MKRENVLSHVVCPVASKRGSEERARMVIVAFMLPGKVTRAEWHQSFSLDKIYKCETPLAKTIPALKNFCRRQVVPCFPDLSCIVVNESSVCRC